MFTKVHTSTLEVALSAPDVAYNGSSINALGMYNSTTFTPTVTGYQYLNWNYGGGDGKSLFDLSFDYGSGGILNNYTSQSVWCNCTITSPKGGVVTALHYYYASDATNYGKKVKYIDLYRIENGKYILHQTFNTSPPVKDGPSNEVFNLAQPIYFSGTLALRVTVRTAWADSYLWVSEIFIKGYSLS